MLAFLDQEEPLPQQLRPLLYEQGRFPSGRTWERRLDGLPQSWPELVGYCGRHLVVRMNPWTTHGRAVAFDSTPLETGGVVWHKKQREQSVILHASIGTEARWSKSGWHGWWYGWKLHLAVRVGALWIPLAAELTVANRGDHTIAPLLLQQLPGEVRDVLGDTQYHDSELRHHKLRSQAIEPFNGLFKNVFEWRVKMPVKGLRRSQLLALGAVVVYQLVLLYQHEQHLPLGKGIKLLLGAA